MKVVLATKNVGKIKEFERMLAESSHQIEVLGLADFPDMPDIEETGTTLLENALLKAKGVAEYAGLPALADDSGLFVDCLGGDPGVYSARWAGAHGDDLANTARVLAQVAALIAADATTHTGASFRCVVALCFPTGHPRAGEEIVEAGEMQGELISQPRGEHGFGYDPIFIPAGFSQTSAELSAEVKDSISHRGKAIRAIAPKLATLL